MTQQVPRLGTIKAACKMIGGDEAPVSASTYYRGVKRGIYPPPEHPSPGISRVDLDALAEALRDGMTAASADVLGLRCGVDNPKTGSTDDPVFKIFKVPMSNLAPRSQTSEIDKKLGTDGWPNR